MSLARIATARFGAWCTLVLVAAVVAACGGSPQPAKHVAHNHARAPHHPSAAEALRAKARAALISIPAGPGSLAAMAPAHGLTLRNHPNGRVIAHLKAHTLWGSPTVVWAVTHRGPWLGVVATRLHNNQIGWVDLRHDRPRMWRNALSLHAYLGQRLLELVRGDRVLMRMSVGIGGPATPTPTGRFTITDKLIPARSVSYYGCCLLALSGHQSHLRPGWAGGDRIAIHGGATGTAASAGCLHLSDADLKKLMRLLPVGTPVTISN